ncbi:MAG: TonB-dependent receptor [Bacteroidota bacterium]|nr:TonB-dependent receptor [Bacteroidota bacterium]
MNVRILIFAGFLQLVSLYATAQETTVSGTVTGENNTPLSGVSLNVKGTTRGTSTNTSGRFTISAAPNATLVFSSVGYTNQEVAIGGRTDITVALATSNRELEQVIVVGYGTQRKIDVTGSVASVKGADIAKQPVLTATQAIQGRVAGVQIISSGDPNSSPTVRIRGVGTMLGGAAPLYVVDGVITDDIRNINSADITSMDILKDASATAIYGMRAANGVLLITTKKGRTGKMIVAYDATVGVKEIAKLVNMAGAKQYANYVNEASIYYGTGDSLIKSVQLAAGGNTDWYDVISKKSLFQNHNLSISGGSDKINYFLSGGFVGDGGVIKTNDFKRYTLRSNNEYKLTNNLRLSTLVSYSRTNLRDVDLGVFDIAYRAAPYVPAKVGDLYGNTSLSNNIANPLLNLDKTNNSSLNNRLQGTFAVDYKPVRWLALHSSYGVDLNFYNNLTYNYKYANTGAANVFITSGGNQLVNRSQLGVQNDNASKWVWDNTATISETFGHHILSLLVGTTAEAFKFATARGTRLDVPENKDQWYLNAGVPSTASNSNSGDKWARNSYLSWLNYSYSNRYLLTATFRADGTSRFPSQNRWGYFPSIGVGWNIAKEAFMANQKTFDNLKLRGSWGKVGNDQIASNLYNPLATLNVPYFYNGAEFLGISFDQAVDKNLKWETTEEYDLGLDFGLLQNRLSGSLEYYDKKTNNALINIAFNGQILGDVDNLYTTNAASFSNKGVELSLNWNDKISKDWNYNISGNISFNKNKITGLNGGQALTAGSVGSQGFTTKSDNGQPIGSFYVLQAAGTFKTAADIAASAQPNAQPGDLKYLDISGPGGKPDGVINDYDRAYSGSYQPKFTYGINGGLSYKTLDFSFGTYGTSGGKIYNAKKAARADSRDNIETVVAQNRWTPNNSNSNIPRANLNALPASTYFLESASFFRINNITLGYTLARSILSRYKIQNLRIYITAQNLATFTPYSGFTPEIVSGSTLDAGIEQHIYPTTRTFAFGVNLGF